ncbi:hypothetical protein AKJ16_DCAP11386 [Drosera capensis]
MIVELYTNERTVDVNGSQVEENNIDKSLSGIGELSSGIDDGYAVRSPGSSGYTGERWRSVGGCWSTNEIEEEEDDNGIGRSRGDGRSREEVLRRGYSKA